eukprot:6177216-Pleurochrysis_carterae.AAC.5
MHRARRELGGTNGAARNGAAVTQQAVGKKSAGLLHEHGTAAGDLIVDVAQHTAVKKRIAIPQIDGTSGRK